MERKWTRSGFLYVACIFYYKAPVFFFRVKLRKKTCHPSPKNQTPTLFPLSFIYLQSPLDSSLLKVLILISQPSNLSWYDPELRVKHLQRIAKHGFSIYKQWIWSHEGVSPRPLETWWRREAAPTSWAVWPAKLEFNCWEVTWEIRWVYIFIIYVYVIMYAPFCCLFLNKTMLC
jgi:hypothetical protein